jgi:threonine/homoserine/homoserine lactone efflux protein
MNVLVFLVQVVVISLSGVLAPGPVTTQSIVLGAKNRFAGSLIAVGHGIVEFPLIILITFGAAGIFQHKTARIVIGLAGGAMLLFMAYGIYKNAKDPDKQAGKIVAGRPVIAGIILSAGNPFFLVWWATVGLALALQAKGLGIWAFAAFAIVHWLCDLIWYQTLSWTSFKGAALLSERNWKSILSGCSAAMVLFGLNFIFNSACLLFVSIYYAKFLSGTH